MLKKKMDDDNSTFDLFAAVVQIALLSTPVGANVYCKISLI